MMSPGLQLQLEEEARVRLQSAVRHSHEGSQQTHRLVFQLDNSPAILNEESQMQSSENVARQPAGQSSDRIQQIDPEQQAYGNNGNQFTHEEHDDEDDNDSQNLANLPIPENTALQNSTTALQTPNPCQFTYNFQGNVSGFNHFNITSSSSLPNLTQNNSTTHSNNKRTLEENEDGGKQDNEVEDEVEEVDPPAPPASTASTAPTPRRSARPLKKSRKARQID